MQQQTETGAAVAAKLSPPATILAAQIAGITVADWVQWLTLIYVFLLVVHKLWKMGLEAWQFWVGDSHEKSIRGGGSSGDSGDGA